jgi:hypothetical protein
MRRTQIQLDEETYRELRRRAYERGSSIAAVVRQILQEALRLPGKAVRKPFSFVGCGRSEQGLSAPISERHDEALTEAYLPSRAKGRQT